MPRRGYVPKREVLPDPVYGTTVVTKLINQIMLDGKRGIAQSICYDAFETVAAKTGKDANEVFQAALSNVAPQLEVKARRVGGATYQVPMEIRPERRQTLALRWIVDFSRKRGDHGRASGRRADGRRQQHRRGRQAQGRNAPHGRGEQGIRSLSLVSTSVRPRRDVRGMRNRGFVNLKGATACYAQKSPA